MKTCIIDCGGGNRGIYGAGVLERLLDDGITFDGAIGISAGSANVATFLAGQRGRLYTFYHDYAFRKEYMSLQNLLKTGEFIGLDYIYGTLSHAGGENPLDVDAIHAYEGKLEMLVTDARTGEGRYLGADSLKKDDLWVLHASCSMPVVCKPVKKDGHVYYDGGIADPIPVLHALEEGYDKIVLILSRPIPQRKELGIEKTGLKLIRRKYPALSARMATRADRYNASVDKAVELQKEGKCLIVAPTECFGVDTLDKTPEGLDKLYRSAYDDAAAVAEYLCADIATK